MDSVGIASTFAITSQAQTGLALQAKFAKMSQVQDANLIAMLQEGADSLQAVSQATVEVGIGAKLDITA